MSDSILQDCRVRNLLTTPEKGYKQDLSNVNLRGANLSGTTLEKANLKHAILSNTLLTNATLKDANLTEAQAVNADFTGACLTGATLEAWNIDSTTTLKDIDCQYVFLTEQPNELGVRERLPHSPDKVFQPGDFEKFFKEMLDEVQILIRDGIQPAAFRAAFEKIMQENPDITRDAIKSIEKQGSDVKVTLQVPEGTDKAKIEQDWDQGYQAGLKAGREAERLESAQKFEELAFLAVKRDVSIQNKNEVMTGDKQSRDINIRGDVHQSSFISGDHNSVTHQIEQLGKTKTQTQLKAVLKELKSSIKNDSILNESDQSDALVEIGTIAHLAQSTLNETNQKAVKRSLLALKGIILSIGEVTHLTETAKPQLDKIAALFDL